MDGTEIPASQLLDDYRQALQVTANEELVDNFLFGSEEKYSALADDDVRQAAIDYAPSLVLDALLHTMNSLAMIGVHVWSPGFNEIVALVATMYLRGFVVGSAQDHAQIEANTEFVEELYQAQKERFDELGLTLYIDQPTSEREDIINPFQGKADNGDN